MDGRTWLDGRRSKGMSGDGRNLWAAAVVPAHSMATLVLDAQMAGARQHKERGNATYGQRDFDGAVQEYTTDGLNVLERAHTGS